MNTDNKIKVFIKVEDGGRVPCYASENAAGCDLYATEDMELLPGQTKIMPLNFSMAIDEDIEAQIRPRSGLSLKTELRIPNGPGTVDSDYRDTVGVILQNTFNIANLPWMIAQKPQILDDLTENYRDISLMEYMSEKNINVPNDAVFLHTMKQRIYVDKNGNPYGTVYIKKGERIAQMVFCQYRRAEFINHPNPREIGTDRGGGFGHTGGR
jgi:dUTP pyrophosphatase